MRNNLLAMILISATAFSSYASVDCDNLVDCAEARDKIILKMTAMQIALTPKMTEIAQYDEKNSTYPEQIGIVIRAYQQNASKYCAERGMRLPTARELALLATSMGADGISESPREGYEEVQSLNPDGSTDIFFFSNKNYRISKQKDGIARDYCLWSSTKNTKYPEFFKGEGHLLFRSEKGTVSETRDTSFLCLIRCMKD